MNKSKINQRIEQGFSLSPQQLIKAKILQLNSIMLETRLYQELESNPALEIVDNDLENDTDFIEVYVKCSIDVCEKRDVRGMYKKARNGKIKNFLGINGVYEPPTDPELIVDTENSTIEQSEQIILHYLRMKKMI